MITVMAMGRKRGVVIQRRKVEQKRVVTQGQGRRLGVARSGNSGKEINLPTNMAPRRTLMSVLPSFTSLVTSYRALGW